MIVTSDGELAERLRRLRTHGGAKQYHHDEVGINSRLDTLQAAVLTAKLPHLASWSEARARNAAAYDDLLRDIDNVKCPTLATGNTHVYHQYTIRARNRDGLMAYLKEIGVGCAVYYPKALHVQPCFSQLGYGEGAFPRSEQATLEVLSLPVYPELTDEQRKVVVARIREFYS